MDHQHGEEDTSITASNVSNALQMTRNLFCPYCADGFLFEFTLKEHLKKVHEDLLKESILRKRTQEQLLRDHIPNGNENNDYSLLETNLEHNCPFCGAIFHHLGLIPKHIANYHGDNILKLWQFQGNNLEKVKAAKLNEPSILYAACSPGLSDIFDNIDEITTTSNYMNDKQFTPVLKSILKKTTSTNKIIYSPSSASIRRTKYLAIKKSNSVRRELRFEVPPKNISDSSSTLLENLSTQIQNQNSPATSSKLKKFHLKNLFTKRPPSNKHMFNNVLIKQSPSKMITSTPINFLDEHYRNNNKNNINNSESISTTNKNNWKTTIRNNHRPLFFDTERFQCAHCKKTWTNNAELLIHLSQYHKGVRNWLRPHYRCGQCGATFFSNRFLVRHCHQQHTPIKMKRIIC